MTAVRASFVLFVLVVSGCAHDYDELTHASADSGSIDAPMDTLVVMDTSPVESSVLDTGPVLDANTDADASTCGALGQRCCEGETCSEGACYGGGRCVAFAGAYQTDLEGACTVSNPMGTLCTCPAGFFAQPLYPTDARAGARETLHLCRAARDVVGAVFRGAWGMGLADPPKRCTEVCEPNAFTSTCGCPAGSSNVDFRGAHFQWGGDGDDLCARRLSVCMDTRAPRLTFGGAFHRFVPGERPDCDMIDMEDVRCTPNPMTGDCSCPVEFNEAAYPVAKWDSTSPSTLLTCPAEVVVCWRVPL